ncbi:MAG: hypothetical protein JXA87_03605 [Thermoleophilia bacterium]|nr:hypothetical protein [Thermoleophilia bacterium]
MDLSDTSRHVPWIVHEAKSWLDGYLDADMTALEWGSGGSTIYLSRIIRRLDSIEHDPDWYADVSLTLRRLSLTNCSYHLIRPARMPLLRFAPSSARLYNSRTFRQYRSCSFRDYVGKCLEFPDESFDFILVDGRARMSCLRHAVGKLKKNGVLMLDNSDRAQYQGGMAKLRHLRRKDFSGPGPFADDVWQTTIWFKER